MFTAKAEYRDEIRKNLAHWCIQSTHPRNIHDMSKLEPQVYGCRASVNASVLKLGGGTAFEPNVESTTPPLCLGD